MTVLGITHLNRTSSSLNSWKLYTNTSDYNHMFPRTLLNMAPNAAFAILCILGKLFFFTNTILMYNFLRYIKTYFINRYIVKFIKINLESFLFVNIIKGLGLIFNIGWLSIYQFVLMLILLLLTLENRNRY